MNRVILIGRLTQDPNVRTATGGSDLVVARYTLAVDRGVARQGNQPTADFITCVAFGKNGEFAEKYLKKGVKIAVEGHIQTGSYKNKEGQTVYTTEIIVDRHEFVESKSAAGNATATAEQKTQNTDFINVPDTEADELPFN